VPDLIATGTVTGFITVTEATRRAGPGIDKGIVNAWCWAVPSLAVLVPGQGPTGLKFMVNTKRLDRLLASIRERKRRPPPTRLCATGAGDAAA
jgi:hypothetical protein